VNPRYKSVALDVDSTLCGIEGIDWLATLRDKETARSVADATEKAMTGEIAFDDVYGTRIRLVSPTRSELRQLAEAYKSALAPGAEKEIAKWRAAGVHVVLISGGLREAIAAFAIDVGFKNEHVNALEVEFDEAGKFTGFDKTSPLYTSTGKRNVLERLALPHPILAVGDGVTDLAMKDVADSFAAFTGFASRDAVVKQADFVVNSFRELTEIILGH
jgi:phosphoserine phosphatase